MNQNNGSTSFPGSEFSNDTRSRQVSSDFEQLRAVVVENFDPRMWSMVEACCSVIAAMILKDATNPVGLVLIDHPSTGKTTALSMFYDLAMVYRSDSFTAASFVSHASNRKQEALAQIDLLPRIQYKCLITPELATIFGKKQEELLKEISILTRVFDGEGYWSDSGSHGGRGYKGDYFFTMLGATPPMPKRVWNTLGQFGSRLLFHTPKSESSAAERVARSYLDVFDSGPLPYSKRLKICREKVTHFFKVLTEQAGGGQFARSIGWDIQGDSKELKQQISLLAEFTSRARSKVSVWDCTNRHSESARDFTQPLLEGPHRLATILYSLARGHATICSRRRLLSDDMPLVVEIALSSMPDDRRQIIGLLLEPASDGKKSEIGTVTAKDIQECLTISRPTALKLIDELALLGIGDKINGDNNNLTVLTLKPCYFWFTSQQFRAYRRARNFLF